MEEEQQQGSQEQLEFQLLLSRFPTLDSKATNALHSLTVKDAIKALSELDQKGGGIRNPSAWICKVASNLRDKSGGPRPPEPPPPKEESPGQGPELDIVDHYGALEVPEDAEETVVKKAYRKLVLKWHPDKHPEGRDEAEDKIRAINNAYETLGNATKRATYDAQRQALQRQKRGMGPDLRAASMAPRQRIPREFMLQPIGSPDKFLRYADERARAHCVVQCRDDARLDGKSGLETFVPFFQAAKLSLWWLPDVNNMCRIRALEARTRSSAGERVVAGLDGVGGESDLKLMEAGKGEKNENVNFIAVPSPVYDNAFRFEGAFRRGYFLAFRPPTQLRMIPYSGGPVPFRTVIDFTLVDFQAMFKFIDIEEVLRPVVECHTSWVELHKLKTDPNIVGYFEKILQKPMWDDDDFQTYFEGHFEMWEFRCDGDGAAVRLRTVDERLGYSLQRVKDADEAANLIVTSGDELRRLHWRYAVPVPALEALAKAAKAPDDVSAAVQRMEAQRLGAMLLGVLATASEASLAELARLARVLQPLGADGAAPDVAQKTTDVCLVLAKLVLARVAAAEHGQVKDAVKLDDLGVFLKLPGVAERSDILARHTTPPLADAPLDKTLEVISAAQAAGASDFAAAAAQIALRHVCNAEVSGKVAASALQTLSAAGLLLEGCASALQLRAKSLETAELATSVAALGDKGHESPELEAASKELSQRGASALSHLPSAGLLGLAVAATKSSSLAACSGAAVASAVAVLRNWPAAEAIRLLLAVAKAKKGSEGQGGTPADIWGSLLKEVAVTVAPHLGELPAAELIRLALAARTEVGGSSSADSTQLLETVAKEASKRLSDLPQAHLLLLTQGLASLGGRHSAMRQICGFWGEVLRDDSSSTDEVSRRRKDLERGQALSGEQTAKLALVLEPLGKDLAAQNTFLQQTDNIATNSKPATKTTSKQQYCFCYLWKP
ncbi:unnamed protein product [Polarella glacialis]|uniref:J domain-containing protein n=1 Tax=Polarella glacialis TaxID=89957 RepID=A0A813HIU8_POLGL|nr:unnamed protein product [Polarella glacialis]